MSVTVQDLRWASRVVRDAVREKAYRSTPLGLEVARYVRWMRNERGATEETLRDYERTLAWLSIDHADLGLADFEPPMGVQRCRDFLDARWGETAPATSRAAAGRRTPRTRSKNTSILRSFFAWAVREGKMHGNPALAISRPKSRDVDQPVFSASTIDHLLEEPRLRDRVALRMINSLALRKSGIQNFQLGHYDPDRNRVTIYTKAGRIQRLPIVDPWLRAELQQYIAERLAAGGNLHEYLLYPEKRGPKHSPDGPPVEILWCDRSKPMAKTTLHRWWVARLKNAGIPHARMHQARHTAITDFLRHTGGNYALAQLLAGHESIQTTVDIYGHLDIDDLAEALRIVADKKQERDS